VEEALRTVRVTACIASRRPLGAVYITDSEGRLAGVLSPR
jgi:Mg/Co/Ni transporter MgtE